MLPQSSKRRSSTGLQTCLQGTALRRQRGFRMDSPAAGVTIAGRCGHSSEFFDRLLQTCCRTSWSPTCSWHYTSTPLLFPPHSPCPWNTAPTSGTASWRSTNVAVRLYLLAAWRCGVVIDKFHYTGPTGPARTLSETRTDPTEFLGHPGRKKVRAGPVGPV